MNDDNLKIRMEKRFLSLYNEIGVYIRKCHAENYAYINSRLLGKAILDYFEDIERLKDFEGMERINESKIYAYETFWLLQRKPIQILNAPNIPEAGLYLNELIFASMMVSKMYKESGIEINSISANRVAYLKLLVYNFKYRFYNQKSLEVAVVSFLLGSTEHN